MANAVKCALISDIWSVVTRSGPTECWKDRAGQDYDVLCHLWDQYCPNRAMPVVPNGWYCPRGFDASENAALAWSVVYRRFFLRMWRLDEAALETVLSQEQSWFKQRCRGALGEDSDEVEYCEPITAFDAMVDSDWLEDDGIADVLVGDSRRQLLREKSRWC